MTLKFELDQEFCTTHLPTKFHHPMFNRSQVIVLTKQTNRDSVETTYVAPLCYGGGESYMTQRTKNAWQSLVCSPPGIAVSPPSNNIETKPCTDRRSA